MGGGSVIDGAMEGGGLQGCNTAALVVGVLGSVKAGGASALTPSLGAVAWGTDVLGAGREGGAVGVTDTSGEVWGCAVTRGPVSQVVESGRVMMRGLGVSPKDGGAIGWEDGVWPNSGAAACFGSGIRPAVDNGSVAGCWRRLSVPRVSFMRRSILKKLMPNCLATSSMDSSSIRRSSRW